MLLLGTLCLFIGGSTPSLSSDTTFRSADTTSIEGVLQDTVPRRRKKAVQVSEWYGRRLTIHRYVAYSTIPVFAAQWVAGQRLYDDSKAAPTWVKTTHRVGASYLAAAFTVNTVTGAWNWWEGRSTEEGRVLRTIHALTMIGADAAFTYAGAKLSEEAEGSADKRRQHRTVALSAMGVTVASGIAMKLWNR
jgi:hypothetical protein